MIQPQELRVGIWVMDSKRKFQLTETALWQTIREQHYKWLEPIPLSHELLEACGFTHHKHHSDKKFQWWIRDEGKPESQITLYKSGKLFAFCNYPPIKWLHHLQNIVHAVTGSELEVKLPVNA